MLRVRFWLAALTLSLFAPAVLAQIVGNAARVNGVPITNLRLERHFDDYVKDKGRNISKMIYPNVYKKLKKEALDQLIEKEVVWQESQRRNIEVKPAEVEAAIEQVVARYKTREDYLRRVQNAGFDEKSYAEYLRQELGIKKFLESGFEVPAVTDEEIHAFYLANPDKFTRPERVRARHVLVRVQQGADEAARTAARKRIEEVLARARKGADFAALAEQYSDDASSNTNGGDLGLFARGRMVPEFEQAVFAMKPGQISDIVESSFGYHVIKFEERDPGGLVPEDQVRERVRKSIGEERRAATIRDGVKALRERAKVEVYVKLDND
jgi:peptidyl-prolyl cis-trans isomerase C